MDARELLKEARYYLDMPGATDGEQEAVAKIDAYLAAPSESAMEVVDELEKLLNMDQAVFPPKDSYEKAAALIEGLQRRVPRAMLLDLVKYVNGGLIYDKELDEIAAKHGVVIE